MTDLEREAAEALTRAPVAGRPAVAEAAANMQAAVLADVDGFVDWCHDHGMPTLTEPDNGGGAGS